MASDIAVLITALIALAVFFGVLFIIFLVIRQFILWYWRVNEMANNIAYIANYLRDSDMDENLAYMANLQRREQREKVAAVPQLDYRQPGVIS